MNMIDSIAGIVGVISFAVSTGIWIYASQIDVPDNIDTVVAELRRAATWNARGALVTGVAVACAMWKFIRDIGWL